MALGILESVHHCTFKWSQMKSYTCHINERLHPNGYPDHPINILNKDIPVANPREKTDAMAVLVELEDATGAAAQRTPRPVAASDASFLRAIVVYNQIQISANENV